MNDAREGFGWVEEFAGHVVCLIYAPISTDSQWKTVRWLDKSKAGVEKKRDIGREEEKLADCT